jgi:hypothetical protein
MIVNEEDAVPTISVDELVAQTMQAFQLEMSLTPSPDGQADAQPNEYSIEITQEVQVDETPDEIFETGNLLRRIIFTYLGSRQYSPLAVKHPRQGLGKIFRRGDQ